MYQTLPAVFLFQLFAGDLLSYSPTGAEISFGNGEEWKKLQNNCKII